jgi:RNA polymerase sigma factor (sigma-70 family)
MKPYPREYLWFVERILRDHPVREQELDDKEKTIIACCRAPAISDTPGNGGDTSEQERILEAKERDETYQRLWRRVMKVREALRTLTQEELELVELYIWHGLFKSEVAELMCMDEVTVWRTKTRVLKKIMPFIAHEWAENGVHWTVQG